MVLFVHRRRFRTEAGTAPHGTEVRVFRWRELPGLAITLAESAAALPGPGVLNRTSDSAIRAATGNTRAPTEGESFVTRDLPVTAAG